MTFVNENTFTLILLLKVSICGAKSLVGSASTYNAVAIQASLNINFVMLIIHLTLEKKIYSMTFYFDVYNCTCMLWFQVVFIFEQKHSRAASGFLKFLPNKNFAMFSPVDHRIPRVNVPLADCPADFVSRPGDYENTLFICRITHWPADSNFAEGWDLGYQYI